MLKGGALTEVLAREEYLHELQQLLTHRAKPVLCMKPYFKQFICIISLNLQPCEVGNIIYYSYKWGNWRTVKLSARNLLHVIIAREITARIRVQWGHALNHYARNTFKQCENYSIRRTEELQTILPPFFFLKFNHMGFFFFFKY